MGWLCYQFAMMKALVLTTFALTIACNDNSSGAVMAAQNDNTQLPPIKVDLPSPPAFTPPDIPLKYPDGVPTVYGLRKQKAANLTKEVKVRATLLEIYQCPVCPKGHTCKLCDQPHFFVGDKADTKKEKALMVVDYLMPKQKPPALTIGKQYDIEGTFAINSPTGFASSEGLLVFTRMKDDKNVEFLSQAIQLEEKAKAGEALEAASLAKKRAAAMKR